MAATTLMTPTQPSAVVLLAQLERDDRDLYAAFLRHQYFLPVPNRLRVGKPAAVIDEND